MAHTISGIITSFKYVGELPNAILVGNFHFIPFEANHGRNYSDTVLEPYKEFTSEARKVLKELSFKGKCAYIETNYFGGLGSQRSEAWHNGKRILGPLMSLDGVRKSLIPPGATLVEEAINETLEAIGVYRHEGKDEFDALRLGWYRSNDEVREEFYQNRKVSRSKE